MFDFSEIKNFKLDKKGKILFLFIILGIVFFVYTVKLFHLQVIEGSGYRTESQKISSSVTEIPAQRGEIFDRRANSAMVINTDSFAVDISPGSIPKGYYDTVTMKLAGYLNVTKKYIDQKIPNDLKSSFQQIEIKNNVPYQTICDIAENLTDLPGVSWRNKPIRNYVETGSICHVLGYVGDINKDELNLLYNKGYKNRSVIGKMGIEKQYDSLLQGIPGSETRTVDVKGRILNEKPIITPPKMGDNLVLTIDSSIQKLAEKALGNRVGATVVLKPSSGEILAMVSYPYFDSNIFGTDNASSELTKLMNDPNKPLLNRAINAAYPPASTFKTIMDTALRTEKTFPAESKIECPGYIEYGDRTFNCHIRKDGGKHGYMDLKNGLAQSCDVYFWVIGRDYLGVDKISHYAQEFGYGKPLGIDIQPSVDGFVPTASWKERRFHEKWMGGDTMNMSIGQGFNLVTPLHVADMMAMVCNKGTIYKPHLLMEVRDSSTGEVKSTIQPEVLHSSDIPKSVWTEVQNDLRYMITNGTATYPMGNKTVKIAGKTGTAEVAGYAEKHWHSWMVAYAPWDAPVEEQVVVATLVEAVNKWEWWAPYATNIIIQGIFNDQTYEQAVKALGFSYLMPQSGGME